MFCADARISVITVTLNSAATLSDTLRSVSAQDYPEIEHLVVDGGSNDGTLALIEQHAAPWRKVVSEVDEGIYHAMNKGIALATGELIGFLNADDFYPNGDVLTRVAEVFRDPAIEACYGDLCYVEQRRPDRVVRYWRAGPHRPGAFRSGWAPPHPTFFVRRGVLERCHGFDTRFRVASDFDLMLRLLEVERVRVHYLPTVLVHMRLGGVSNRNLRNVKRGNREILSALRAAGETVDTPRFLLLKGLRRLRQFVARPPTR